MYTKKKQCFKKTQHSSACWCVDGCVRVCEKDYSTSGHTFAPCDMPLSAEERQGDIRECFGIEARHRETFESAAT